MNSYTGTSVESNLESSNVLFVTINYFKLYTKALIVLDCNCGVVPARPTSSVCKS